MRFSFTKRDSWVTNGTLALHFTSVYLKDYVEKLKKDKMKPFYNKKNNNFEIDNIYDYLKIIDILQNEKEKDRTEKKINLH